MHRYYVTITRTGGLFVEAENMDAAMDIANHQTTDEVRWSEEWEATEAFENDTLDKEDCVTEKAFD